jgi:hypothetical protein
LLQLGTPVSVGIYFYFSTASFTLRTVEGLGSREKVWTGLEIEKFIRNSERRIEFSYNMIFTADHCRTLATSGTETNSHWAMGAAFVEASAA